MFTNLRLRNFKCYEDSGPVPLRPLTILVGPNNAGKSTLLQALLMIKQTMEDPSSSETLVTFGTQIDLGATSDIVRQSSVPCEELEVSIGIVPDRHDSSIGSNLDLTFSVSRLNRINLASTRLSRNGETVLGVKRTGKQLELFGIPDNLKSRFSPSISKLLPTLNMTLGGPNASGSDGSGSDSSETLKSLQGVMGQLSKAVSNLATWTDVFAKTWHVSPIRLDVPRIGQLGKVVTSEFGSGGEHLLRALKGSIVRNKTRRQLVKLVDEWIAKHQLMIESLSFRNLDKTGQVFSLMANERAGSRNINVANMGKGVSQMLPIIANVLSSKEADVGLIEQPEIHLHPSAQAELADLFVEHISKNPRGQLIIETHSEHLLLRIRRRIASGVLPADKVAVLYIERKQAQSQIQQLDLDPEGHFLHWPSGFFEDGYREALAISEAATARKKP